MQVVKSQSTRKRFKACFDKSVFNGCALALQCPTQEMKKQRVYYFDHDAYLLSERLGRLKSIPPGRRHLRNNVEASVKEFTCRMPNKKLKVRGAFKASVFAFTTAMAINYGRIYRMMLSDPGKWPLLVHNLVRNVKEQWLKPVCSRNLFKNKRPVIL